MASYCPCGKQSPEFQAGCHPAGMRGVPIPEAAGCAALKPPALKLLIFIFFFWYVILSQMNVALRGRPGQASSRQAKSSSCA